MTTELYCKDCKHSFKAWYDVLAPKRHSLRCRLSYNSANVDVDPVTGPVRRAAHYERCAIARFSSGVCGKEGKLWEPKYKKHMFLDIKYSDRQHG